MKRFFVMILLVSVFFIGLGSLIERGQASLKSDARALELIRLARIAIGGDANIERVRSMTISAKTTHFFEHHGSQATEQGSLDIALQLPNQFTKMVRIGHPDEGGGNGEMRKEVRVVVTDDGNGDMKVETSGDDGKRVMKVRTVDETGDPAKSGGTRTVTVKKGDGTVVQEIKVGDGGDAAVWTSKDGKNVVVDKDVRIENVSGDRSNELLRMTLSLLLSAPEGLDVAYAFAGEENVDGNPCNVVLAQAAGSSMKLFLDKSTNLPRMVSYESADFPHVIKMTRKGSDDSKAPEIIEMRSDSAKVVSVEHQLKFSDFRTVEGLLLPFRWDESAGGRQMQTVDVSSYEINPANIADKFTGGKVFVRTTKPNQ